MAFDDWVKSQISKVPGGAVSNAPVFTPGGPVMPAWAPTPPTNLAQINFIKDVVGSGVAAPPPPVSAPQTGGGTDWGGLMRALTQTYGAAPAAASAPPITPAQAAPYTPSAFAPPTNQTQVDFLRAVAAAQNGPTAPANPYGPTAAGANLNGANANVAPVDPSAQPAAPSQAADPAALAQQMALLRAIAQGNMNNGGYTPVNPPVPPPINQAQAALYPHLVAAFQQEQQANDPTYQGFNQTPVPSANAGQGMGAGSASLAATTPPVTTNAVSNTLDAAVGAVSTAVGAVANPVISAVTPAVNAVTDLPDRAADTLAGSHAGQVIADKIANLPYTIENIPNNFGYAVQDTGLPTLAGHVADLWNHPGQAAGSLAAYLGAQPEQAVDDLWSGAKGAITDTQPYLNAGQDWVKRAEAQGTYDYLSGNLDPISSYLWHSAHSPFTILDRAAGAGGGSLDVWAQNNKDVAIAAFENGYVEYTDGTGAPVGMDPGPLVGSDQVHHIARVIPPGPDALQAAYTHQAGLIGNIIHDTTTAPVNAIPVVGAVGKGLEGVSAAADAAPAVEAAYRGANVLGSVLSAGNKALALPGETLVEGAKLGLGGIKDAASGLPVISNLVDAVASKSPRVLEAVARQQRVQALLQAGRAIANYAPGDLQFMGPAAEDTGAQLPGAFARDASTGGLAPTAITDTAAKFTPDAAAADAATVAGPVETATGDGALLTSGASGPFQTLPAPVDPAVKDSVAGFNVVQGNGTTVQFFADQESAAAAANALNAKASLAADFPYLRTSAEVPLYVTAQKGYLVEQIDGGLYVVKDQLGRYVGEGTTLPEAIGKADAVEVASPPLSMDEQRAAAVAQRDAVNQALYAKGPYAVTDEYGKVNPLARAVRNLRAGEAGTTVSDLGAQGANFTEPTGRFEVTGLPGEPTKVFNSAENAQAYVDQQNAAWLQAHPAPPPSAAPIAPAAQVATEASAQAAPEAAPAPEPAAAPASASGGGFTAGGTTSFDPAAAPTAPEAPPATYGTVKNADGSYAVTRDGRPVTLGMDGQDALDQAQMYGDFEKTHGKIPADIRKAVAPPEPAPVAPVEPTPPTEPAAPTPEASAESAPAAPVEPTPETAPAPAAKPLDNPQPLSDALAQWRANGSPPGELDPAMVHGNGGNSTGSAQTSGTVRLPAQPGTGDLVAFKQNGNWNVYQEVGDHGEFNTLDTGISFGDAKIADVRKQLPALRAELDAAFGLNGGDLPELGLTRAQRITENAAAAPEPAVATTPPPAASPPTPAVEPPPPPVPERPTDTLAHGTPDTMLTVRQKPGTDRWEVVDGEGNPAKATPTGPTDFATEAEARSAANAASPLGHLAPYAGGERPADIALRTATPEDLANPDSMHNQFFRDYADSAQTAKANLDDLDARMRDIPGVKRNASAADIRANMDARLDNRYQKVLETVEQRNESAANFRDTISADHPELLPPGHVFQNNDLPSVEFNGTVQTFPKMEPDAEDKWFAEAVQNHAYNRAGVPELDANGEPVLDRRGNPVFAQKAGEPIAQWGQLGRATDQYQALVERGLAADDATARQVSDLLANVAKSDDPELAQAASDLQAKLAADRARMYGDDGVLPRTSVDDRVSQIQNHIENAMADGTDHALTRPYPTAPIPDDLIPADYSWKNSKDRIGQFLNNGIEDGNIAHGPGGDQLSGLLDQALAPGEHGAAADARNALRQGLKSDLVRDDVKQALGPLDDMNGADNLKQMRAQLNPGNPDAVGLGEDQSRFAEHRAAAYEDVTARGKQVTALDPPTLPDGALKNAGVGKAGGYHFDATYADGTTRTLWADTQADLRAAYQKMQGFLDDAKNAAPVEEAATAAGSAAPAPEPTAATEPTTAQTAAPDPTAPWKGEPLPNTTRNKIWRDIWDRAKQAPDAETGRQIIADEGAAIKQSANDIAREQSFYDDARRTAPTKPVELAPATPPEPPTAPALTTEPTPPLAAEAPTPPPVKMPATADDARAMMPAYAKDGWDRITQARDANEAKQIADGIFGVAGPGSIPPSANAARLLDNGSQIKAYIDAHWSEIKQPITAETVSSPENILAGTAKMPTPTIAPEDLKPTLDAAKAEQAGRPITPGQQKLIDDAAGPTPTLETNFGKPAAGISPTITTPGEGMTEQVQWDHEPQVGQTIAPNSKRVVDPKLVEAWDNAKAADNVIAAKQVFEEYGNDAFGPRQPSGYTPGLSDPPRNAGKWNGLDQEYKNFQADWTAERGTVDAENPFKDSGGRGPTQQVQDAPKFLWNRGDISQADHDWITEQQSFGGTYGKAVKGQARVLTGQEYRRPWDVFNENVAQGMSDKDAAQATIDALSPTVPVGYRGPIRTALGTVWNAYKALNTFVREHRQYGWLRGPISIISNYLGDMYTQATSGAIDSLAGSSNPLAIYGNLGDIRAATTDAFAGTTLGQTLAQSDVIPTNMRGLYNIAETKPEQDMGIQRLINKMFDENTKATRNQILTGLSKPLADARIRDLKEAIDLTRRFTLYGNDFLPAYAQARDQFFQDIVARGDAVGGNSDTLTKSLGDVFSPRDVLTQAQDAGFTEGQAERMARDWRETITGLDRKAFAAQQRVAFDYAPSSADEFTKQIFQAHTWQARAAPLYLENAIRNPVLANAYYTIANDMAKDCAGRAGATCGYLQLMTTAAGYAMFMKPQMLLSSAFINLDPAYTQVNGSTLDNLLAKVPATVNPPFQGILSALGMSNRVGPDVLGLAQDNKFWAGILNYADANWFGGTHPLTNEYDKIMLLPQQIAHAVSGGALPAPATYDVNGKANEFIQARMRDLVYKDFGVPLDTDARALAQRYPQAFEALLGPNGALTSYQTGKPNQYAQEAYQEYTKAAAGAGLATLFVPGGVTMRDASQDTLTATRDAQLNPTNPDGTPILNPDGTPAAPVYGTPAYDDLTTTRGALALPRIGSPEAIHLAYMKEKVNATGAAGLDPEQQQAGIMLLKGWGKAYGDNLNTTHDKNAALAAADQWASDQGKSATAPDGALTLVNATRAAQDAVANADPVYAGYEAYRQAVKKTSLADMDLKRKSNPNFDAYLSSLPPTEIDTPAKLTTAEESIGAYLAWRGEKQTVYSGDPLSLNDPNAAQPIGGSGGAATAGTTGSGYVSPQVGLSTQQFASKVSAYNAKEMLYNEAVNKLLGTTNVDFRYLNPMARMGVQQRLMQYGIQAPIMPRAVMRYEAWAMGQTGGRPSDVASYVAFVNDAAKKMGPNTDPNAVFTIIDANLGLPPDMTGTDPNSADTGIIDPNQQSVQYPYNVGASVNQPVQQTPVYSTTP